MNQELIQVFIISKLAELKQIPVEEIDVHCSVFQMGLDSSEAIVLTGDIEDRFGILLDPAVIWDHSTVSQLADFLASNYIL